MILLRPLACVAVSVLFVLLPAARSETPMKDRPAAEERLSFHWKSPASVAWRVHTVDAELAALALLFSGIFLRWRAREKAAAHTEAKTTNDKLQARP